MSSCRLASRQCRAGSRRRSSQLVVILLPAIAHKSFVVIGNRRFGRRRTLEYRAESRAANSDASGEFRGLGEIANVKSAPPLPGKQASPIRGAGFSSCSAALTDVRFAPKSDNRADLLPRGSKRPCAVLRKSRIQELACVCQASLGGA